VKIIMELSALEAIKAKKPIYLAKSLHEIEQRASREMRAAYRPSEREIVMETRPTLGKSVVLTLVQDAEDPTSFDISRGSETFGSDKITLTELLSMDAAKQGDDIFYGRSPAANMVREAQSLALSSPSIEIESIVSEFVKQDNPSESVKVQNEEIDFSRPTLRR
jgi:hypothetical protein